MTETQLKLRVWWIRNVPNEPEHYEVSSVEDAIKKIDEIIKADLKEDWIHSNAGGLEQLDDDGEWTEFYDDGGRDINEIMDEKE